MDRLPIASVLGMPHGFFPLFFSAIGRHILTDDSKGYFKQLSLVRMVNLLKKVRNMSGMKIFTLTFKLEVIKAKSYALQTYNCNLNKTKANLSIIPTTTPPTDAPGMVMGAKGAKHSCVEQI